LSIRLIFSHIWKDQSIILFNFNGLKLKVHSFLKFSAQLKYIWLLSHNNWFFIIIGIKITVIIEKPEIISSEKLVCLSNSTVTSFIRTILKIETYNRAIHLSIIIEQMVLICKLNTFRTIPHLIFFHFLLNFFWILTNNILTIYNITVFHNSRRISCYLIDISLKLDIRLIILRNPPKIRYIKHNREVFQFNFLDLMLNRRWNFRHLFFP